MSKLLATILLFCFATTFNYAQDRIIISGKIIDAKTKEGLPFASIGLSQSPVGTVTNLKGEFDLHIQNFQSNEVLVISMLGYKNYKVPIIQLTSNTTTPFIFELEASPKVLEEVLISDSLSGLDILNIAFNKIEFNYANSPYMLEGFYRDYKKVNGQYVSLLEAALNIYDKGYDNPKNKKRLHEKVKLLEVRKSLGYNFYSKDYFNQKNLLEDILLRNIVRYKNFGFINAQSNIQRLETSYFNDKKVFIIDVKNENENYQFYINTFDYAIMKINLNQSIVNNIKVNKLSEHSAQLKLSLYFKKFDNNYYLSLITSNYKSYWSYRNSSKVESTSELTQLLLINNIVNKPEVRIKGTEKMRKFGLQFQDKPYNEVFWKNYNIIKETPLDKKIIFDLEKELTLDQQFLKNQ